MIFFKRIFDSNTKMDTEVKEIEYVNFGMFSSEEILKISVLKIDSTRLAGANSVHDERLGINSENSEKNCVTCGMDSKACWGHYGHIELNEPIIHPTTKYFKMVIAYLRCFCIKCYTMLIDKDQILLAGLNRYKRNTRFEKILEKLKKTDTCFACNSVQPKIMHCSQDGTIKTVYKQRSETVEIPLDVNEIIKIFEHVKNEDVETLGFNPKLVHPKNLILTHLLVLPPCARPIVITDSNVADDDLTNQYIEIIKVNNKLLSPEENSDDSKKQKNLQTLKFRIGTLFDNRQGKAKHSTSGKAIKGIVDRITGKEGQIRNNLMGKRCEQTARTVIGPEPTLRLDQVAIPFEIASNLTVPETVTPMNRNKLWELIENGKANFVIKKGKKNRINLKFALHSRGTELLHRDIVIRTLPSGDKIELLYLGQSHIQLRTGDAINRNGEMIIPVFSKRKPFDLDIGDTVERQLQNGDDVMLNRQPTLHKGSIMAKKIVILPFKTFRFNLACTKSFNADFDGDEMNIHVPQTIEARAECLFLSSTKHNLITPQSSKPNIQIVQDSLLASYLMTKSTAKKLTKEHFFNISNYAIDIDGSELSTKVILDRIQAIRRVYKLKGKKAQAFSGRGLVSLILPSDFNYENTNNADLTEPTVRIYQGVMYEGALNKSDLGNMLLHILYKEYGREVTSTFIDNIQFLTHKWLIQAGFTVGIKDCIATRTEEIQDALEKCFLEAKGIEETTYHEGIKEIRVNAALSKARDIGLRIAKNALSPDNNFVATVTAGSKGDFFNVAQVTGLLGQQNLCGQRVPKFLNKGKRTLPHYPLDPSKMTREMEYESRGFIRHSFIHGLNPQEFYFHAMSGREGITDTAMGTSKSGYIQRRIIKIFEDTAVKYDGTVRNTENNIYQFIYGDDGLDASETIFKKGEGLSCDVRRLINRLNMKAE
jgi:DNA-directed RNA polymerase beta' subunit